MWNKSGRFSVKSMYSHLSNVGVDRSFKHLWKAKVPLKIKIWLWLIWHNAILTKDNMRKRGWEGDFTCRFCQDDENIGHLFFTCVAARYVWGWLLKLLVLGIGLGPFLSTSVWAPQFLGVSRNVKITVVAVICWAIWKLKNRVCFEKNLLIPLLI